MFDFLKNAGRTLEGKWHETYGGISIFDSYPQVRTDNGPARKAGLHRRGQPTPVTLKDGTWWMLSMDNDGKWYLDGKHR